MTVDPPSLETASRKAPGVSFETVFTEHAPFVWRALRRLGVRDADADDACQDVFVVVHRKLSGFDGRSSLRTWLYGICLRIASEHRRRPHQRREEIVAEVPESEQAPDQDESVERRRAIARLDAALDRLDEGKRAVFVLFEIEQITMAEVAAAIGCPLQTAYSRLYAARKVVETALSESRPERSSP